MSYRIYVNRYQLLGNNECPNELIEVLQKQGAEIEEDGNFEFKINDLQEIVEALELYIRNTYKGFIAKKPMEDKILEDDDLTSKVEEFIECGYLFVTYNLLQIIKGQYKRKWDMNKSRYIYVLNEDHDVVMSAY